MALPADNGPEPTLVGRDTGQRKPKTRTVQRLERAQQAAFAALGAVSSYLDADEELPAFFGRLSESVAGLVGARRAAFWRLGARDVLSLQPRAFGFPANSPVHELRIELGATEQSIIERIAFRDELDLVQGTSPELDALWREVGLVGIKNSIAVSWRAGDRRIGVVVAYDSRRGFNSNDLWVMRLAAMATGLVWQYKEAEDELGTTAVRLEEAVAARRRLMNNIASGGDEARRRFASSLHDDSLQLLTAAELQLERIRAEASGSHQAVQFDQLKGTLHKVEDSLRRLLTNVSTETLELNVDLHQAISERLESVRVHSGIETQIDLRLPQEIPAAIQAIVVKNVAEALTNVEKHAHATRVLLAVEPVEGGIKVEVIDDGAGFVVAESVHMPGHLGLLAMKERAQLAGGWFRIESEPGSGA
ncbi:MAG TPA: ATP-binding protein, partial [Candidatus Dormibacteraeota bacterium]|nr:ATP-binding protein [Candidatus Dormibacteraeota bacterium]